MDINVNKKILPPFLVVLFVLIFACSKKNLVYYSPSNTSKTSVNEQVKPLDVVSVQQYEAVVHQHDSPTTPSYNETPVKRKSYSFSEEGNEDDSKNNTPRKSRNNSTRSGRYVVLIIGIILLSIGGIWMLSLSNKANTPSAALEGCFNFILSLALTIAGVITTIVGAITAAIN
jgi:hypothetical protein